VTETGVAVGFWADAALLKASSANPNNKFFIPPCLFL
jgi:hypothetical protein